MDEIRITLRIPPELHAALKQQAQATGRSLNEQIVYSLTRYLGVIDALEQRVAEIEQILISNKILPAKA